MRGTFIIKLTFIAFPLIFIAAIAAKLLGYE